ncbi:unnamed protein product [Sphagnum troendelagicum]
MAQQNKITYHNDQTNKHQVYTPLIRGSKFPLMYPIFGFIGVQKWRRKLGGRLSSATSFVRQLSQELPFLLRNSSRVQASNSPDLFDPELAKASLSSSPDEYSSTSTSSPPDQQQHAAAAATGGGGMVRTMSGAEYALEGLRFISQATATADQKYLWEAVETRFKRLASYDNMLARSNFAECIGMTDSKEFANELFDALVRRKSQQQDMMKLSHGQQQQQQQQHCLHCISKEELYEYWLQITDKSFDSRMRIFFALCDKDSDGRITGEEVKEVIRLSASANKLSKLKEQANEYAALIMEELDVDQLGYIELSQLEKLMEGSVAGIGQEGMMQYSQLFVPQCTRNCIQRFLVKSTYWVLDNWKRLWIISLWLIAMTLLFCWKFHQYHERSAFLVMGYCLCVAKGAAETLKLNMALILLPVCRNTLTWLRSTRLSYLVPFDDNLDFHKLLAGGIAFGVLVHSTLHITCDLPKLVTANPLEFDKALGNDFHFKQPSYGQILKTPVGVTGLLMLILMLLAFLLAMYWFRRNLVKLPWPFHRMTGFNAFWYSHHLFVLVYALLFVHSTDLLLPDPWWQKSAWMYISIPILVYAGERTLRALRAGNYKVDVVKAAIYTGNVLAIHMTKPDGFKYKSGMYLFLQCPEISSFEWHPFSITSAPGDLFLSVHIRTSGDWTNEMKRIFSEVSKRGYTIFCHVGMFWNRFPRLYIDGPYGAPAQDYLKYDVLLLVGLGIGATPFISILKDMLNHIKAGDPCSTPDLCPAESPRRSKARKPRGTTNAYFYWVTREQGSFDWFRGVMREVEDIDKKAVIEMHNYLTSVYEEGDARSTLVMMLQALHHAKNGIDLVSGTRARTHFARPNWKNVFSRLAATHNEKRIGVFYCGPMALAKELELLSRTFSQKSTTKFEFHKESF